MVTKEKTAPGRAADNFGNKVNREGTKKPNYIKSRAVKELERLADEAARKRFPDTPAEWLAPRKFKDDSANGLTRCIIHFLQLKGHQCERVANMGRQIDTRCTFADITGRTRTIGSTKWIKGTGTNGSADISATIAGKSVKIEVKYKNDRQSEAQKQYQQSVERAGGLYVIARTFEQFFDWYKATFEHGK